MRRRTSSALVASAVAALGLATAQPAAAADHLRCTAGVLGSEVCVGVQTTGGDVRGYASVYDAPGGDELRVTVRSLVLQRRACGGTWQAWTTTRTTGDTSGVRDTDVTQWVLRPGGVQFRSVATYSVEQVGGASLGRSGTATSAAFGAC